MLTRQQKMQNEMQKMEETIKELTRRNQDLYMETMELGEENYKLEKKNKKLKKQKNQVEKEKKEVEKSYNQLKLMTDSFTERYVKLEENFENLKKEKEHNEIDNENVISIQKRMLAEAHDEHAEDRARLTEVIADLTGNVNGLYRNLQTAVFDQKKAEEKAEKLSNKVDQYRKKHEAKLEVY